jgi:regulator of CtrA degradation
MGAEPVGERDVSWEDPAEPVDFGRTFVQSEAFRALFQEGMDLVAEAAAYLDGEGRIESARLHSEGSRAYAAESMRLTTRLMQIASWLLVQRAAAEGDIGRDQVRRESSRIRLAATGTATTEAAFDRLPAGLRALVGLSARLHARILHLDLLISEAAVAAPAPASHPVAMQRQLIERAFRGRGRIPG